MPASCPVSGPECPYGPGRPDKCESTLSLKRLLLHQLICSVGELSNGNVFFSCRDFRLVSSKSYCPCVWSTCFSDCPFLIVCCVPTSLFDIDVPCNVHVVVLPSSAAFITCSVSYQTDVTGCPQLLLKYRVTPRLAVRCRARNASLIADCCCFQLLPSTASLTQTDYYQTTNISGRYQDEPVKAIAHHSYLWLLALNALRILLHILFRCLCYNALFLHSAPFLRDSYCIFYDLVSMLRCTAFTSLIVWYCNFRSANVISFRVAAVVRTCISFFFCSTTYLLRASSTDLFVYNKHGCFCPAAHTSITQELVNRLRRSSLVLMGAYCRGHRWLPWVFLLIFCRYVFVPAKAPKFGHIYVYFLPVLFIIFISSEMPICNIQGFSLELSILKLL